MNKKIIYLFIALLVVVGGLFAVNKFLSKEVNEEVNQEQEQEQVEVITSDMLTVPDQAGGEEVFIGEVRLKTDGMGGFVVIHRVTEEGKPGAIIGTSAYLEPGVSINLLVTLNDGEEVAIGEKVIAMLHADNGDQVWDPATDAPIVGADGVVVMQAFIILAEEDLPGFETKL